MLEQDRCEHRSHRGHRYRQRRARERQRRLGVDLRAGQLAPPKSRLRAVGERHHPRVVGAVCPFCGQEALEEVLRVVEAVGADQAAGGIEDRDVRWRHSSGPLDGEERELGGALRRFAGHRHVGGDSRELGSPYVRSVIDATTNSGSTRRHPPAGVGLQAGDVHELALDVAGQRRIGLRCLIEHAIEQLDALGDPRRCRKPPGEQHLRP
ncbi:MAG: hypothetical protein ACR2ML_10160 [Solirubrobacteraceae bacterium]